MPPSPPPQVPSILPRQPGETQYAYRKRRSIALTGETPYERRIRSARARGFSTTEARGHRANESQIRRERTIQQTGYTPWELWRNNQLQWLNANGYSPVTTGWSWNRLIRIAPRLRWLNERAGPGGQITPEMMIEAINFEQSYGYTDWSWERINEKYEDTVEFVYAHNNQSGRFHWFQDRIPDLPVAWWYYH